MTMRNRKTIIVAFMLAACMLIGVGYAALTDMLYVEGNASYASDAAEEAFDADIYFSKALGDPTRVNAYIDSADKDVAYMKVVAGTLKDVGNEVIATYTIKSESDLACTVTPTVTALDGSALDMEYFQVYTNVTGPQALAAGSTIDVTVTIKLVKTNATGADLSTAFKVNFDVQSN